MPAWPYGVKRRGLASTAAVGLMKASCIFFVIDAGSGLPFHLCSAGLGSNRSIWLGPPSMNRKMTFFALAGKCGFLGASGLTSALGRARPSCSSSGASAIVPMPPAHIAEEARGAIESVGIVRTSFDLLPRNKFVQVQQHAAQLHPCRCLRRLHAFDRCREERLRRLADLVRMSSFRCVEVVGQPLGSFGAGWRASQSNA